MGSDLVRVDVGSTRTLLEVLRLLHPVASGEAKKAAKVPEAKPLSAADRDALNDLPSLYEGVVALSRRSLEAEEVQRLLREREVLDRVANLVTRRKEAIRQTVLNHLDVVHEEDGVDGDVDGDGHLLVAARAGDAGKVFRWDVSEGDPQVVERSLEERLSHEDWLACTRQVRVFDPDKALELLRRSPRLIQDFAAASVPGKKTGRLTIGR